MKLFLRAVSVILFASAIAKIWSANSGASPVWSAIDPLFGVTFGALFLLTGIVELSVAVICGLKPTQYGLGAVAWLSIAFITYRLSLWWIGWQKPCGCLGNLTDALNISPQLADNVMKGLLAFMFIGSVSLLIVHHRQNRAAGSPESPVPEQQQA